MLSEHTLTFFPGRLFFSKHLLVLCQLFSEIDPARSRSAISILIFIHGIENSGEHHIFTLTLTWKETSFTFRTIFAHITYVLYGCSCCSWPCKCLWHWMDKCLQCWVWLLHLVLLTCRGCCNGDIWSELLFTRSFTETSGEIRGDVLFYYLVERDWL